MTLRSFAVAFLALLAASILAGPPAFASPPDVLCEMTFDLEGRAFFYHFTSGRGEVTCDNGQSATVALEGRGGGLTFGKRRIVGAQGRFSEVRDISEIFGDYVQAEAHAGAGRTASAQVVTKGEVSLAMAGTGQGVDLGITFGRFSITEVEVRQPSREEKKAPEEPSST